MPETSPTSSNDSGIVVTTEFVRHRNVMLARARMTELFVDYHLHLADTGMQVSGEHAHLFKQMLTAYVLHNASRPRVEMAAWTASLQEPRLNLFATGDNETGAVVGRVFTENVKPGPSNLLYVETVLRRDPLRRSVVSFADADLFSAAAAYYQNSEQRPARFFDLGDEEFALLSAHPDCDLAWMEGVAADDIRTLAERETLALIERRRVVWFCGCNERRMLEVLAPTMRANPADLFGDDDSLRMECPRCGRLYRIGREALEAFVANEPRA